MPSNPSSVGINVPNRRLAVKETAPYVPSPICADGRLYGAGKKGELVVIQASPQYQLLSRSQLLEGSYATPAVANGSIYFRTFHRLICVGSQTGSR